MYVIPEMRAAVPATFSSDCLAFDVRDVIEISQVCIAAHAELRPTA